MYDETPRSSSGVFLREKTSAIVPPSFYCMREATHLDLCAGRGAYGDALASLVDHTRHVISVDHNRGTLGITHTYRTDVWDGGKNGYFRHTRLEAQAPLLTAQHLSAIPMAPTQFDRVSWCFPCVEVLGCAEEIVRVVRNFLKPHGVFILRSAVPWTPTPNHLVNAGGAWEGRLRLAENGFTHDQSAGRWLTSHDLTLHDSSQLTAGENGFEAIFRAV